MPCRASLHLENLVQSSRVLTKYETGLKFEYHLLKSSPEMQSRKESYQMIPHFLRPLHTGLRFLGFKKYFLINRNTYKS